MSSTSSWCLLEDAAVALGCSTRTIRRRVAAGRLDARPGPDGRTLVRLPDEAAAPSAMLAAVQEQVESGRQLAAVMAMTHRDTLSRLQAAEEAIRRRSRWTWLAGSVAAASLTGAVLLSAAMTDRVKTADGQVVRLEEQRQAAEAGWRAAEAGRAEADRLTLAATADRDLVREQAGRLTDRLSAAERERDRLLADLDRERQEAAARRFGSMVDILTRTSTGSPTLP
jgi:hypothetical protein